MYVNFYVVFVLGNVLEEKRNKIVQVKTPATVCEHPPVQVLNRKPNMKAQHFDLTILTHTHTPHIPDQQPVFKLVKNIL